MCVTALHLYRPSGLEIAAGWVAGAVDASLPPEPSTKSDPLEVLIEVVLPSLSKPPCFVMFSGGRDSSAVLAVATLAARREGLPLPIPLTDVFPDLPDADETSWQEQVLRHLRLDEWERMEFRDEIDVIGPVATRGLVEHGLTWPASFHTRTMLFERTRGGAVLTGNGGDEVFGPHRIAPVTRKLSRRVPGDAAPMSDVVDALSPKAIRRVRARRSMPDDLGRPWLTPAAIAAQRQIELRDVVALPLSWKTSVRRLHNRRGWQVSKANFDQLSATYEVQYRHPLLDPAFLVAFAAHGGHHGYISRTYAMRSIFEGLLPESVIRRTTKASFNGAMVNRHSLQFAQNWSGTGVDTALVDPEALREEWCSTFPHGGSLLLLQAAWLASQGLPPSGGAPSGHLVT